MTGGPAPRIADSRGRAPALVLFLLVPFAAGCGSEAGEAERAKPGARAASGSEDNLTLLYTSNEWLFSPSHDGTPKFLVFLPLVDPPVDPGGTPAGDTSSVAGCRSYEGALAESWEHSPDYRTWTVRLREGVRWHDGEPVTAHDVVFTVDLWQHLEVEHYAAAGLDSAVALDERTVRFHLTRPGDWPLNQWYVFYPEHLLADKDPAGFFEWDFWTRPVGNGPYRYVRHVPETMVELEANPDFDRGEPAIDRLRVKLTAAGRGTGLVELRSGDVDLVGGLELPEAELLSGDERFRVHTYVHLSNTLILWGRWEPLFQDVRVRRALTQAIDRRALHRLLRLPERAPLTDGPYTPCQYRQGELTEPWPYDLEATRQLLEEAGWRDADGDGVRERDGRPFRFTLTADGRHRREAVFVQDQLRQIGVQVEIRILDENLVNERVNSGQFQAVVSTRGGRGFLNRYLPDGSPLGFLPERLPELAQAARHDPDWRAREVAFRELAELFRTELLATFLHPGMRAVAARREIRGLELLEEGVWDGWRWPLEGVEFLWIEEEAEREEGEG